MRWNVEGADARTGKDRLVTIEADTEQSAEQIARNKGMLIAAVHPVRVVTPAEKLDHVMAGTLDASMVTTTGVPTPGITTTGVTTPGPREQLAAEWNERVTEHTAQKIETIKEQTDEPAAPASPTDLTTSTLFTAPPEEPVHGAREKIAIGYRTVVPRLLGMRQRHPSEPTPQYVGLRVASIVLMVLAGFCYLAGLVAIIDAIWSLVSSSWSVSWRTIFGVFGSGAPLAIGAILHALSAACAALRDIAQNSFNR